MRKNFLYIFLVFFISGQICGQEFFFSRQIVKEESLPRISSLWRAGEYLIFDCLEQSYICISKKSFKACGKRRAKSRKFKGPILSCAPLKKYKNYEACLKAQYLFIQSITDKRFCRNFDSAL